MFPFSVQSRIRLHTSTSEPGAVLDRFSIALAKEGIAKIDKCEERIDFVTPLMFASYQKFAGVSSGTFKLVSDSDGEFIEYKFKLRNFLYAIGSVVFISVFLFQAENLTIYEKLEISGSFFAWLYFGSTLLASVRLRRWVAKCLRQTETPEA